MRASLIISSQNEIADLISASLPQEIHVDLAGSFKEALRVFQNRPSDIIFFDLDSSDPAPSAPGWEEKIRSFKTIQPWVEVIVLTSKENINEAVNAVDAGAYDYLCYPIDPAEIRLVLKSLDKSFIKTLELDHLKDHFWKSEWLYVVYTRTAGMQEVFKKVRAVAPTKATVLLSGETGTGKGLLARLLHRHSNRCDASFISVHCGAIPETLLESELFGHEKGAFTGALRKKPGKFEIARHGTIFLDEIGTIAPSAQIKLLQVLQDGTFSRIGGDEELATDARVISATNSDLTTMIESGAFRKDLYYRLNIFPIEIPPLRQRVEDIPYLIDIFLDKMNLRYGKAINRAHPHVIEAFKKYDWPGNIREMENLIERAYILETTTMLTPESLPMELFKSGDGEAKILPVDNYLPLGEARRQAVDDFERQYLKDLFSRNKGKVKLAAENAGITTRQLNKLMVKYDIKKELFKV